MRTIRILAAALVAFSGLALSAPDADAHGRNKPKKKFERRHRPHQRAVYKWVWDDAYRTWRWQVVYVNDGYYSNGRYYVNGNSMQGNYWVYDERPHHDHPFPEHDGHEHDDHGGCRF